MVSASELVVALRAENADETISEVEGVEESINETADSMGETSAQLDEMNQAWTGAMGSMVAALSVSTGFLLSRVPVIGESMEAFGSILTAVGFQLDGLLRPAFSRINNILYDVSAAIFEAEGAWGSLIGVLSLVAGALLGALSGLLSYVAATQGLAAAGTLLVTALKGVVVAVGSFVASIVSIPVLIGAAVAALALLAWHFREDIVNAIQTAIGWLVDLPSTIGNIASGIADFAVDVGNAIADITVAIVEGIADVIGKGYNWGKNLVIDLATGISDFVVDVATAIADVTVEIVDAITGVVGDTYGWGKDIVIDIADGIAEKVSDVATEIGEVASEISTAITDLVDDAYGWGTDLISEFIDGIQAKADDLKDTVAGLGDGIKDRLQGNSPPPKGPLSDFDKAGPTLVDTFASGMRDNMGQVESASNSVADAAGSGSSSGFRASRNETTKIFMSGRRVDEQTGRFGKGKTIRRGL